jgi:cellulose synthase/poly-beta-1,6-N-acetylglucosamine synthase-like glycosyltransferase
LIISGAFGLFRKDLVLAVGGYSTATVGEDMELVLKLHKYLRQRNMPYEMKYVSDPTCWTEAPANLRSLFNQRIRWQRGLMESLLLHKDMLFNPRYGFVGVIAIPYFWFFEMIGPLIEAVGYLFVLIATLYQFINLQTFILLCSIAILWGIMLSLSAIVLEEVTFRRYTKLSDFLRLTASSILENVGYRQLVTWWRAFAFFYYFFSPQRWGKIDRSGFTTRETVRQTSKAS